MHFNVLLLWPLARGATMAFLAIILLQVFVWDVGDGVANDDDVDGDAIGNLERRI